MRKTQVRVHFIHAFIFTLLLMTGLCLLITPARTWFNQIHFPLVTVHFVIACMYILIVIIALRPLFRHLFKRPFVKKYNGYWTMMFAVLWIVSGLMMYFQTYLPVAVRNYSVIIHDWATFLFLPWVIVHSAGHFFDLHIPWPKWWRAKAPVPEAIRENKLQRRDFIKFFGLGFLFLLIGGSIKWLIPTLSLSTDANKRRGYFRIYNVTNDYPHYETTDWSLTIDGHVNQSETVTLADVPRFPSTMIVDDFHCVTGWSVHGVEMKGILVKDLLKELDMTTSSPYVTAYSGDKTYYDTFTTKQLLEEEAMLVFEMDGQPLKKAQGYPCRLYHPSMYGYKSVKWLNRLEFTDERERGYWQKSGGYDLNGYL
ncbi:molybdopterin-dependent oxidoreductase [Halobacillus sp. BBL2006]|uniref:molybdopterin-dependent oxidoreductase n=1 Tax=Halobacillus sp. BBL2006 TaxID=1543706 RepID=UPI0018CC8719|nr:molybdopterin-dependent oxidoreductase [Halobacillus sp. BBL2006]